MDKETLGLLGLGVPILGSAIGGFFGNESANKDRALTKRSLAETEQNNKFQRLLALMSQSQGMQNNLAGSSRLLSLRNAGSVR
jgi:hypothetical protein